MRKEELWGRIFNDCDEINQALYDSGCLISNLEVTFKNFGDSVRAVKLNSGNLKPTYLTGKQVKQWRK